ncbi:MAG: hypothetical protein SFU98_20805 [Leptospiraceae bacterium]|nr:hypothetical protein [Leptospiraceae bacterium]
MNSKILLITLFGFFIALSAEDKTPPKDFLSYAFAYYTFKNPGKHKSVSREEAIAKSKSLNSKGEDLNKKKKYSEAMKLFEEAIEYHATGEVYYNYGNTLSNVPNLKESIDAYKIADKLGGYKRPELIQYNIACSYSRMDKVEEAYKHLAFAVDRGYNAFKYIQKDSDMENLRKRQDWEERINALIPKSVKFTEKDFIGTIEIPTPRTSINYFLCKSGIVIMDATCEKGFYRGKWSYKNSDLIVKWNEECRSEGVGNKMMSAECDLYEKYKFNGCKKVDAEMEQHTLITDKTMIHYMKGVLKNVDNLEMVPIYKKSVNEPKACDPNFIPKKMSDL